MKRRRRQNQGHRQAGHRSSWRYHPVRQRYPLHQWEKDQWALFERLHRSFQKDKLQSTYTGKGFEENGELFRQLANTAQAFTVDKDGNPKFTLKLLDDEYLLLGDDRIVSKDSRQVGAFKKEQIKGQAVFRLWPIYPFKTY